MNASYNAPADLTQQRAALAAEQAVLPQLEQQELESRDALAILLGKPPEGFTVSGDGLGARAPPAVTAGLPSELLVRRPDIAAAEATSTVPMPISAAARAAFFPSITLTASGGVAYPALAAAVATLPGTGLALGGRRQYRADDLRRRRAGRQSRRDQWRARMSCWRPLRAGGAVVRFSDVENALGAVSRT